MKINPKIHQIIDKAVLAGRENREPSGRLAAGKLGWPLQHQMLHYYKVPQEPVDEYTLRKFQRGKDVEDRIVDWVNPDAKQVPVEYRGVVGVVDMVIDGLPYEVKSVTNMAFKHIQKDGVKLGHKLQAMHYAKALGKDTFHVCYVASDDYRTLCIEESVTDEVDNVIDQYEEQVETGIVPVFIVREAWQANIKYNSYPAWMGLNEEEIAEKLAGLGIVVPQPLPLNI